MSEAYLVLSSSASEPQQCELEVKKSRFIALGFKAASRDEAMTALEQSRQNYPDARHHCWAYLVGPPHSPRTLAMSDDGEPSGTAGKPILNVLQHGEVGDIMVIVVRYFGGIKLGAGGLVRAYSGAAQALLDQLELVLFQPLSSLEVKVDFSQEQVLRHWLSLHGGLVQEQHYREAVELAIELPEQEIKPLKAHLAALGGQLLPPKTP